MNEKAMLSEAEYRQCVLALLDPYHGTRERAHERLYAHERARITQVEELQAWGREALDRAIRWEKVARGWEELHLEDQAEVERLREALREIALGSGMTAEGDYDDGYNRGREDAADLARTALHDKEPSA